MTEYAVIYEKAPDGSWWASPADLPVFAVGDTRDEAEREVRDGIAFYLEELGRKGDPIPESRSVAGTVRVERAGSGAG